MHRPNSAACTQAAVKIPKNQVVYPTILQAYDAVGEWVGTNKATMTGAPREVYFDPRPWHQDRPQRPKVWGPDTLRNYWGFGSERIIRGYQTVE